jgi:RHS repeat-associated protein
MSTSPSNAFYYHVDPLGSVRDVTDTAGATQLTYDYEPFGAIGSQTGTLTNPVKFTGQYQDPTGLYHLRARQYDSVAGRFLSLDPAAQVVAGRMISQYTYADNRPTLMVDPSGATHRPTMVATGTTRFATSREPSRKPTTSAPQQATRTEQAVRQRPRTWREHWNFRRNSANPGQSQLMVISRLNNAAARELLFANLVDVGFGIVLGDLVDTIVETITGELPGRLFSTASAIEALTAARVQQAAFRARRFPDVRKWVTSGLGLRTVSVTFFDVTLRGYYVRDAAARVCPTDQACDRVEGYVR